MAARKTNFSFENSHMTKIWRTNFPKEFVNEIWLTELGDCKYIYIAGIKFYQLYFRAILRANWFFVHPQVICFCKKQHSQSHFFSSKEGQLLFKQSQKYSARNIAMLKCQSQKTKCWVPWYPLMQLTVNDSQIYKITHVQLHHRYRGGRHQTMRHVDSGMGLKLGVFGFFP